MRSFASVYVCLRVYLVGAITFGSLEIQTSFFGVHVQLQNAYIIFVCESHRVKVKATGAKRGCTSVNKYAHSRLLRLLSKRNLVKHSVGFQAILSARPNYSTSRC